MPQHIGPATDAAVHEHDCGTLGRAFSIDARETNAFSKLARYESNIERLLFRALRELQRLHDSRVAFWRKGDSGARVGLTSRRFAVKGG